MVFINCLHIKNNLKRLKAQRKRKTSFEFRGWSGASHLYYLQRLFHKWQSDYVDHFTQFYKQVKYRSLSDRYEFVIFCSKNYIPNNLHGNLTSNHTKMLGCRREFHLQSTAVIRLPFMTAGHVRFHTTAGAKILV